MKKASIAILGSTSHIAKGLIANFLRSGDFSLSLYARSPDRVHSFLRELGSATGKDCDVHRGYVDLVEAPHDVIINCVGAGTAKKLQGRYADWFTVTEEYDNLAIQCLRCGSPEALYISFSSGAVYGRECLTPAEEDTRNSVLVNHVVVEDYYGIARLNAEAKHRAFSSLRIVDLRLFSYFSRFIDLTDGYFITDLLNCVLSKKVLATNSDNIVRDYVHPRDLFSLIRRCMDAGMINGAYDVASAKPVEKREILDYFSSEYGLEYELTGSLDHHSATGAKNVYWSRYDKSAELGYKAEFTSMDAIREEAKHIIDRHCRQRAILV